MNNLNEHTTVTVAHTFAGTDMFGNRIYTVAATPAGRNAEGHTWTGEARTVALVYKLAANQWIIRFTTGDTGAAVTEALESGMISRESGFKTLREARAHIQSCTVRAIADAHNERTEEKDAPAYATPTHTVITTHETTNPTCDTCDKAAAFARVLANHDAEGRGYVTIYEDNRSSTTEHDRRLTVVHGATVINRARAAAASDQEQAASEAADNATMIGEHDMHTPDTDMTEAQAEAARQAQQDTDRARDIIATAAAPHICHKPTGRLIPDSIPAAIISAATECIQRAHRELKEDSRTRTTARRIAGWNDRRMIEQLVTIHDTARDLIENTYASRHYDAVEQRARQIDKEQRAEAARTA